MNAARHLTEAERHDAADGTRLPEQSGDAAEHLEHCESCAADVARIKQLMTRIRELPAPTDSGDDLWADIRSRIERDKIIQLPAGESLPATRASRSRRWVWLAASIAAAALLVVVLPPSRGKGKAAPAGSAGVAPAEGDMSLIADSTRAYEQEATFLLNELELRRAMMPPRTRASIDHDLKIIDQAIAELKDAITNDPNNPALRRLLASSYKQKVDLLKRAGNAG